MSPSGRRRAQPTVNDGHWIRRDVPTGPLLNGADLLFYIIFEQNGPFRRFAANVGGRDAGQSDLGNPRIATGCPGTEQLSIPRVRNAAGERKRRCRPRPRILSRHRIIIVTETRSVIYRVVLCVCPLKMYAHNITMTLADARRTIFQSHVL